MIRDGLDAEGFIPGLIDLMRHLGAGDLYGLTPHFSSQAVFWNKDLFNRFHVDYPTDRMSWEELFGLAARFPNEGPDGKRVYGLDLGTANLHEIASDIGIARGLRVVNPSDGRMAVDSEAWVRVYEMALEAVRSGALYREEDEPEEDGEPGSFDSRDPFITGKAAMTIRWDDFLNDLRQAAADPDGAVRNWDIVSHPVDPANPEYSHAAQYGDIFAINEASVNRDAAWNVIRYIHGDDFARAVSKIRGWGFPVRKAYIRDDEGRNLAAFYTLKPAVKRFYAEFDHLPAPFFMDFHNIGTEVMQAVTEDRMSVREALADLRVRLQAALDEAKAAESAGTGDP